MEVSHLKPVAHIPTWDRVIMVGDVSPFCSRSLTTYFCACHTACLQIEKWSIKLVPIAFHTGYMPCIATPLAANNEACYKNWRSINHNHEQQSVFVQQKIEPHYICLVVYDKSYDLTYELEVRRSLLVTANVTSVPTTKKFLTFCALIG